MDEKEAKWLQEIRDSLMEGLDEEALETEETRQLYAAGLEDTVLALAEDKKRYAAEFEKSSRAKNARWPENLIDDVFRLKWAELKESAEGERLDETLSRLLETLTEREGIVIQKFYKEEKSLKELGDEFSVFYPEIYGILQKALNKLRHPSRSRRIGAFIVKSEDEPDPYGFNNK